MSHSLGIMNTETKK